MLNEQHLFPRYSVTKLLAKFPKSTNALEGLTDTRAVIEN